MRTALWVALVLVGCGGEKTTSDTESSGAPETDSSAGASSGSGVTEGVTDASSSGTGGGSGAPAKYSDGCAPTDGAAVDFSIGISERSCMADFGEDAAMLRISLYQGATLPPGVYTLDGGKGGVAYDAGKGEVVGSLGTLTIVEAVADGLIGSYEVTLSDMTQLSGDFAAIYCPQDVICG